MQMQMNRREFTGHLAMGAFVATAAVATAGVTCNVPNWVDTAVNDLPTILNIATTVATIVANAATGGALTPAIAAIIATATAAVNVAIPVIQDLIAKYKANPTAGIIDNIKTALLDVQNQLGQILTAAHVVNATLRAVITTSMGLAIGVITAILSLLPAPAVVAGALKAQAAAQSGWVKNPTSPTTINAQLNAFLQANGYGKFVH
jgi:hypothetical protein